MIIRCPSCSSTYKVESRVFEASRPSFRCSRCKHIFTVHLRLQLDEAASAAASATTGLAPVTAIAPAPTRDAPPPPAGDAPDLVPGGDEVRSAGVRSAAQGAFPDAGTGETRVDAGVEQIAAPASAREAGETHAAPSADPPAPPHRGNRDDFETDDGSADAGRSCTEFDSSAPDAGLPHDPHTLTFERADGLESADTATDRGGPDFEVDDFLIPPRREEEAPPPDAKGSVVPFVSLVGIVLCAAGLVTLTHMVHPQPLDSLLRRIPWYGPALFDSKHYKSTLAFESMGSGVRTVLNRTEVFFVSGKLMNRSGRNIRQVEIEARIFDAEGQQAGLQTAFVGNAISARIIEDMSLREIALLQSLRPQSAYHIPPDGSADFTIVFPKPKAAVASFNCRVLAADAAP